MTEMTDADDERLALGAFVKLVRAAETVSARVHRRLADADLTVSQFGVLEALHSLGPLCQKDLAGKILKSSGNLTLVIANLEKRGLITRERGVEDKRFLTVSLSEAGARLIETLLPEHVRVVADQMRILSAAEQRELGRLCRAVGRQER